MKIQLQTNILSTFFKKLHENFVEFCKTYVGVQSWKAAHLPTLEIRVEQKGLL